MDARQKIFDAEIAELERVAPGFSEKFATLSRRLLAVGAKLVAPPGGDPVPTLDILLAHGRSLHPTSVKFTGGDRAQCVANAARLVRDDKRMAVIGYALSRDGVWAPHTWIMGPNNVIIDTLPRPSAYFGLVLNQAGSKALADQALGRHE